MNFRGFGEDYGPPNLMAQTETYGPVNPAATVLETYTVARGDTLGTIASRFLGSPTRWKEIWDANPQVANPNVIAVGQVLNIPSERVDRPAPTDPGVMPGPRISAVPCGTCNGSGTEPTHADPTDPDSQQTLCATCNGSGLQPYIPLILIGIVALVGVALLSRKSRTLVT